MKIHKLLYTGALFTLLFATNACDEKLDIPQKGVIPTENFYKTDADCQEAVTALYASMKDLVQGQFSPVFVTNLLSDDCYSGAPARLASDDKESINEYRFDSSNPVIEDIFEGLYNTIYRCNLIINNYEEAATEIQRRAVAEAKLFRGYCYFHLTTLFGDVALNTEAVRNDYKVSRAASSEVWTQIEKDLTEAISSNALPTKNSIDDKTTGIRATNDFAKAMLGKVYVFEKKWANAVSLLDEVIASGRYGLLDNYTDYARASFNNNKEILFSDNKTYDPSNEGSFTLVLYNWNSSFFNGLGMNNELGPLGFGFFSPSTTIIQAFKEMEGEDGYRFKQTIKSYNDMLDMGISLRPGIAAYAHCGYGYWKVRMRREDNLNNVISTWQNDIVMRLAEVILLSAEAHIMLGDGQGDKYLNMIRDKAHLPRLSGATLDDLKKEKQLELCLEGCRYQDLIRWGDASTALKSQWDAVPNFEGLNSDGSFKVTYPDINHNKSFGFITGKHELLPIPLRELNVNPNMTQNPKW